MSDAPNAAMRQRDILGASALHGHDKGAAPFDAAPAEGTSPGHGFLELQPDHIWLMDCNQTASPSAR